MKFKLRFSFAEVTLDHTLNEIFSILDVDPQREEDSSPVSS